MKLAPLFCLIILLFLSSCTGKRLDGSSPEKFKVSAKQMKNELSNQKKDNYEKAMRVILLAAMRDKFNKPDQFEGKSFDQMMLDRVSGKTFNELVEMAEAHLKLTNSIKLAELEKELAAMKKNKAGYDKLKKTLDLLKGRFIKIDLKDGHPFIFADFKNVSAKMFDQYSYSIVARTDSGEVITSASRSFSGVGTVMPGDILQADAEISDFSMKETPEMNWSSIKYPITDPEKYHIKVEVYTDQLTVDDVPYDLASSSWKNEDQQAFEQLEKEIIALKKTKGTLDELELTR